LGKEIIAKGYKTVNMLGCHDGIPVLDLKGKEAMVYITVLIEAIMNKIMERGGRVKIFMILQEKRFLLVNATFF
jgi:sucrose phosphorylase